MFVEPREQQRVERLGEVVSVVRRTVRIKEDGAELLLDEPRFVRERRLEDGRLDSQKVGDDLQDVRVPDHRRVLVLEPVDRKLQVPEMEDGGDELAGLSHVPLRETDGFESDLELIEPKAVLVPGCVVVRFDDPLTEVAESGLV